MEPRNRGERLKQASDRNKVQPFSFLQEDGTFSETSDISARLSISDRFLATSNLPLQRRMLHTRPEDALPDKCVLRHGITKDVYLLGQGRYDTDGEEEYERLSIVHLVTNKSSTFVEVFKYAPPKISKPSSMALERVSIGKFYISVEHQGATTEKYSDREQSTRMLFYGPCDLLNEADELCEFEYNGKMWAIKQVFYDSGFSSGVIIDTGQNIDTYNIVSPTTTYDPTTGSWDFLSGAYLTPFSASLAEDYEESNITSRYGSTEKFTLYVKGQFQYADNFHQGMIILFPNGSTYRVDQLHNNRRSPDVKLTLSKIVNRPSPVVIPE